MIWVKHLHVTLVILSAAGFLARAAWTLAGSPLPGGAFVRVAPHVLDTVLLLSGLALAFGLGISPVTHPWLASKLLGVVTYIVLGSLALRRARTRRGRVLALVGALLALGWIFGAALTHRPFLLA